MKSTVILNAVKNLTILTKRFLVKLGMTKQGFLVRLGMTGRARNDKVAKPAVILKPVVILNAVKNLTILTKRFLVKLGMTRQGFLAKLGMTGEGSE